MSEKYSLASVPVEVPNPEIRKKRIFNQDSIRIDKIADLDGRGKLI